MELTNDFEVGVPVEQAWAVLTDLERIAPCMPGAKLEEVEGDDYRGIVKVKVGPVTAQYKGTATITEKDDDNHRAVLNASGRDTRGQGNANATITATLTEAGGKTRVELVTDLNITGKVAQFGRGVMADVSGKLLGQFVDNLETMVLADDAETSSAAETSAGDAAVGLDELVDADDRPPAPAEPTKVTEKVAKKAVKKVAVTKPPVAAPTPPRAPAMAAPSAPAASTAPTSGSAAANNGVDTPKGPTPSASGVRKIDSPDPEPVDLLDAAGGSVAQRVIPAVVAAIVVLLVIRSIRRRRRQRS